MRFRRHTTNGEYEAIRKALTAKIVNHPGEMSVEDIVATVVADTLLIAEGTVSVEAFGYNVWNTCGESCAECDAHGNPEPCEHGCETHPDCPEYVSETEDWIGNPSLSAAEKIERFEALGPEPTRGPRTRPCEGRGTNVCVAEGCYGESCVGGLDVAAKTRRERWWRRVVK